MPEVEEDLVDYLAGDLSEEDEKAFEEALFDTPGAAPFVATTLAIQDGIALVARALGGGLTPAMARDVVDALRESGRRLHERVMRPGEDVTAPLPEGAEFLVGHLELPPGTEGALDLVIIGGDQAPAETRVRITDVPWDRETGRMSIVCERHVAERDRVTCFRLLRTGGDEKVADYVIRNGG